MVPVVKSVAVIGAGSAGLTALKTCLNDGLEPVCMERRDKVGGLWNYTEKVEEDVSSVMKTTSSNSSKELSCYSDYPAPRDFPNFMHHRNAAWYFRSYADNFNLNRHIRFNTEVTMVRRADDFAETGRWIVESIDHKTGARRTETYDAVMVASGHHTFKFEPKIPGLDEFKGTVIHSHDYRENQSSFDNLRVLVVGMGNSATDVAVELSRNGRQVFLSTRKGTWLFHAYMYNGQPVDTSWNTRFAYWLSLILPASWFKARMNAILNHALDHDFCGLTPEDHKMQAPLLSDELFGRMFAGLVKVKGEIKRFTRNTVEFTDGTSEEIDAVAFGTGYNFNFPFIEKEVVDVKDNQMLFYKHVFVPDLPHQTMAFIGFMNANACLWPISELHGRLASAVFRGKVKLPSRDDMWKDIRANQEMRAKNFPNTTRHSVEVVWVPEMEELAKMIGCQPNMGRLMLTDPKLAWKMIFGPCLPAHYRLEGPGKWDGARDSILNSDDRIRAPFQTRPLPPGNMNRLRMRTAQFIMYPPMAWAFFLELLVVGLVFVVLFR